jgi:hypothetical protein
MFRQVRVLCLLACVAGWSAPGPAQPVYRCGDNSYSNKPCPGGREIQADDPRTAAQRAQTTEAAKRDAKVADDMEKSRLKEEAKAARAAAPLPVAEPALQAASSDRTYSPFRAKKPQYFTAVSPRKDGDKANKVAKKKKTSKKALKQAS